MPFADFLHLWYCLYYFYLVVISAMVEFSIQISNIFGDSIYLRISLRSLISIYICSSRSRLQNLSFVHLVGAIGAKEGYLDISMAICHLTEDLTQHTFYF